MALEKSTVSINLGKTQSQANDDFSSPANQLQSAYDITWDKELRYSKRPGQVRYVADTVNDFPNPDTIGSSSIKSQVFEHDGQLVIQNKGSLYSWDDQRSKWVFKGHHYPLTSKSASVTSSEQSLDMPKSSKFGDYVVYAYRGTDQITTKTYSVRLQIKQISTGLIVLDDYQVDSSTNYIDGISLIQFTSKIYLSWCSGANIKICEVTPSTGAIGAITTLKSDYLNPKTARITPDWEVCNKSGVGERAFCVYVDTSNNFKVFAVTSAGALDATLGTYSTAGGDVVGGFSIYYSPTNQRLYISSQHNPGTGDITARIINFTSSAYTLVAGIILEYYPSFSSIDLVPNGRLKSSAFIDDPLNSGQVILFYSTDYQSNFSQTLLENSDDFKVCRFTNTTITGTVSNFSRCVSLAGRPYYDSIRQTIYVPVIHYSTTQGTMFLLDFYKGKYEGSDPYAFVQLKTNYRTQSEINSGSVPSFYVDGTSISLTTVVATRISSSTTSSVQYHNGIADVEINLAPDHTGQAKYFCGSTYLTGGFLAQYDGRDVCENNFFLQPTTLEVQTRGGTELITAQTVHDGSGAQTELSRFIFTAAPAIRQTTAATNYCEVYYSPTVKIRWSYSFDGVGTAPTGGNFNLLIDLNGYETSGEVARKTLSAIIYNTGMTGYPDSNSYNTIYFESHTYADTPNASVTGYTNAVTSVTAGTRQVCVVWSWIDANGFQHRSAPSSVVQLSTTGQPYTVVAYCPTLTNRQVSSVRMEVYMTVASGSTFYRYGSIIQNQPWKTNAGSVGMYVNVSDTTLQTGEVLYTTGSVTPNGSIGACDAISVIKNRLVASQSNGNYVYYSKTASGSLPVEMAETFFIALDNDGQNIVGHTALDDKWIIFREKSIIAYAGDGANNLGQGVTLSLPQSVSSDVGCRNPNSIELTPNGIVFDSKMGIGLITRGLEVLYPGENVKDLNGYAVEKAVVLKEDTKVREVRFVMNNSQFPVYHYLKNKWAVWTSMSATDACLWNGAFARIDANGVVWVEDKTKFYDGNAASGFTSYNHTITTTWLKIKNQQDWQRIYRAIILGRLYTRHTLRVRAYYDYDSTNYDQYTFDTVGITGSSYDDTVYQPEIHLKRQKCEAIQLEIAAIPYGSAGSTSEKCADFIDLSFQVGIKQGLAKVSAGKRL